MNKGYESMKDLVSVIVPIYKTEEYLDKCISSILSQTYENIEIILVDDGSPDHCSKICDLYRERDSRIKVIYQQNAGAGQARNRALDIAQGMYIIFVDSDDYIAPAMIESMYRCFSEEIDIVECDFCEVYDDNANFSDVNEQSNVRVFSTEEAMLEHINDHYFRQLIWNKMYRRSITTNVRFPVGKKIDDEFWTYKVLGNAKKLIHINKVLYAYRQQSNSVMHLLSVDRRLEAVYAKIQRHQYICTNIPNLEIESLYSLWLTCIYQGQKILQIEKNKIPLNIWRELENTLKQFPIRNNVTKIPIKQRIWITLAKHSLYFACKCRNMLNIGI